jgi:hypothetical protein
VQAIALEYQTPMTKSCKGDSPVEQAVARDPLFCAAYCALASAASSSLRG